MTEPLLDALKLAREALATCHIKYKGEFKEDQYYFNELKVRDAIVAIDAAMAAQDHMTNLTITITTEQASSMIRLLDLATRIHMCQFENIEYLARTGAIKGKDGEKLCMENCDIIRRKIDEIKNLFGFSTGASFGIASPHVDKDAQRGYEIKKVIEKALAEHSDPNPSFRGVNYDGLMNRITTDPAPVAIISHSETNKE